MPPLPLPIHTKRLVIRRFHDSDLCGLHELHSDVGVAAYLSRGVRHLEEVKQALTRRMAPADIERDGDGVILAVVVVATGHLIGEVSLWLRDARSGSAEVGFALVPAAQRQGYAREAMTALLALAFDVLGLQEVFGTADQRNVASMTLMRRLGMQEHEEDRDGAPLVAFSITRQDWQRQS